MVEGAMEKNREKIRAVFWLIVISGSLLLGLLTASPDFNPAVKIPALLLWLAAIAAVSVLIDLLWYRAFNRRLKVLQPILLEECDPDRYIQEISALLEGKKSPQLRGVLLINLCAAYCEKKEYDTAKALLLQIDPKRLVGINRPIFWAALAYVHFYLGEDAKACTILAEHRKVFASFSTSPQLGGLLAILSVFQKLWEGDKANAKALLAQERPKWEDAHNAPDFDYLVQLCQAD